MLSCNTWIRRSGSAGIGSRNDITRSRTTTTTTSNGSRCIIVYGNWRQSTVVFVIQRDYRSRTYWGWVALKLLKVVLLLLQSHKLRDRRVGWMFCGGYLSRDSSCYDWNKVIVLMQVKRWRQSRWSISGWLNNWGNLFDVRIQVRRSQGILTNEAVNEGNLSNKLPGSDSVWSNDAVYQAKGSHDKEKDNEEQSNCHQDHVIVFLSLDGVCCRCIFERSLLLIRWWRRRIWEWSCSRSTSSVRRRQDKDTLILCWCRIRCRISF